MHNEQHREIPASTRLAGNTNKDCLTLLPSVEAQAHCAHLLLGGFTTLLTAAAACAGCQWLPDRHMAHTATWLPL
jgi:hypothetical protein